ncbi:MAG: 16S rRNA (uracil(1498)-N(3))-methyltransferase [Candidatus Taylorbacteria bacterium]|nr:16S rRNA (uracil(1498)-N(3))-methyltransferase [Candidatus Taylorbacteria bacterium]
MRLHNFFIDQKIGGQKQVIVRDSDLLNQWRHVLRLNTGSSVVLFDNSGFEYLAQFTELTFRSAALAILEKRKNKFAPKKEIFLFQAIIKPDRFEWILEKATELGVSHFRPVLARRSAAKKLDMARERRIVKEAAEQSGRAVCPDIAEPVSLEAAVSSVSSEAFALDPSGSSFHNSSFVIPDSLSVFIGPEDGWSEEELKILRDKKISVISLGSQILRAETAAVAASSLLLL